MLLKATNPKPKLTSLLALFSLLLLVVPVLLISVFMARKKVRLQWIQNDSARKATFNKRKKGLMKKVSELSTLCGVEACAIVYGPYDPAVPDVWPPTPADASRVIERFRSIPEMEQGKKMMNQESFLCQRIGKVREQKRRLAGENLDAEIGPLVHQCVVAGYAPVGAVLEGLGHEALRTVERLVGSRLKAVQERLEKISATKNSSNSNSNNGAPVLLVQQQTPVPEGQQQQAAPVAENNTQMVQFECPFEMLKGVEPFTYNTQLFWPAVEDAAVLPMPPPPVCVDQMQLHGLPTNNNGSNQYWFELDQYFHG